MKFTITKKNFLTPLQKLNSILFANHKNPITNNIFFYIHNKYTYLISTNLELEIIAKIHCSKIFNLGEILVSGKKILSIVRSFPSESEIHITAKNNIMTLQYKNIIFKLNTLHAKTFPRFKTEKITRNIYLNQYVFKNLIYNSHYAMAKQDVRHYLNGLNIEINSNKIFSVATDGYRMAITYTSYPNNTQSISIIIPYKTIIELIKLLESKNNEMQVYIGNKIIQFNLKQYTLSSKLIENQFPKYVNLIQKEFDKHIILDREKLKQALLRALIVINQKLHGVRIIIQKGLCIIQASNEHDETIQEEFQINYSDEPIELTMNINYFLDVINIINQPNINIFLQNTSSIIYIKYKSDYNSYHIIMPLIL
ncbi:DNA polymerase III subunit beta [Buchnera aphidicola (Takecallis taiwana)]|uniref:DNA polymerase III subunit beta n=1 Tax=Buchnera aphidicola TaxID=9 RepID=UPI0031B6926D